MITWIPEQIRKIFSLIKISKQPSSENCVDGMLVLNISYDGKPVSSFDYTYFDGMDWSNIYSAKDGLGVIELLPGMAADNLQIRCEYEFAGEAHTDKEIESVVKVMKGTAFRDAYIWVRSVPSKETSVASVGNMTVEPELNANSTSDVETSGVTFIEGDDAEPYEEKMNRILLAVRDKNYDNVRNLFTDQGWVMFEKLLAYGQARLINTPRLCFIAADNKVIAGVSR